MRIDPLIEEIINIITKITAPDRIFLFGSRALGFETERSDIDIAVQGGSITDRQIRQIRDAVGDIRTLHKIDIVLLDSVSAEFRQEILKNGKVIYERQRKAAVCC